MSSSSSSKGSSFWIFVSFSLLCEISVWFGFRIDFSFRLDANKPELYYEAEIEAIRGGESTMMYIDFSHVMGFNDALQKAIADEYLRFVFLSKTLTFLTGCEKLFLGFWFCVCKIGFRFEPYLRNACKRFVIEMNPSFISDDTPNKDINVSFYNLPFTKRYCLYPQILILNFSVWWLWWW